TLPALSARSWIAPVRGTCRLHTRSTSDHGVDGALETGNEHLPHVSQRVHNNLTRCFTLHGLTSYGRRAAPGIREGDELGYYS
ncbi:hypothetical protein LINGRAHAP2_LOCUS31581, partial [Linum grandiflorum]